MPFHRQCFVAMGLLALVSLSGCRSAPPPPPPPMYPPEVRFDSPDLYGRLGVQVGVRKVDDLLFPQIQVTNWAGHPIEVEYQFYFYDASGFQMRDPNARWALIQFGPNEQKTIDKNAPQPGAVRFEIHFRWPSSIH